jgi:hypothetical protein
LDLGSTGQLGGASDSPVARTTESLDLGIFAINHRMIRVQSSYRPMTLQWLLHLGFVAPNGHMGSPDGLVPSGKERCQSRIRRPLYSGALDGPVLVPDCFVLAQDDLVPHEQCSFSSSF